MNNTIAIIAELVMLVFNILIFMQLTIPKRDNFLTKAIMVGSATLMLIAFAVTTYVYDQPEAAMSFVCITIPSSVIFFCLSKYKDFRFFVTFCFLDTLTIILTFFSRAVEVFCGKVAGISAYIFVCVIMCVGYFCGKSYFKRYRELMENVNDGWGAMALSTALIYILLIISSAYPKPMIQRTEYFLPYLILSLTVLSFYAVFVFTLLQKKELVDYNRRLMEEKKWHDLAYIDSLTGLKNRMAYMEKINELERVEDKSPGIYAIMMDVDDFKSVNDSLGHHMGDFALKKGAEYLNTIFNLPGCELFRIGGDEFAITVYGVEEAIVNQKISQIIAENGSGEMGCSFSIGISKVRPEQNNSIESAFIRADKAMYAMKSEKKITR